MDQLFKETPTVSVVIINWNTTAIVASSLQVLLNEVECTEIIVVDNGSKDASYFKYYFADHVYDRLKLVLLSENFGSSHARNIGINLSKGEYIFLLDGDIKYVKGTIKEYLKVFDEIIDLGCVGHNHIHDLKTQGYNGSRLMSLVDVECPVVDAAYEGFPMAWTQYGLFKGGLLRKLNFPTHGPFGEPGHGYEDDWLYQQIKKNTSFKIVHVEVPVYYHQAHSSLEQLGVNSNTPVRRALYLERFGSESHWTEHVRNDLSDSYEVYRLS